MHFTLAMMSFEGEVDLQHTFESAGILSRRAEQGQVQKFEHILRNDLQQGPSGGHVAHIPVDRSRKIWLQLMMPWTFSAVCTFEIAGEPTYAFMYLPGYYRDMEIGPTVMEHLLQSLTGKPVRVNLQSVPQRPLVTCIPSPLRNKKDATDLIAWALCFAVAYFEFAAERHAAMPAHLQDLPKRRDEATGNGEGRK